MIEQKDENKNKNVKDIRIRMVITLRKKGGEEEDGEEEGGEEEVKEERDEEIGGMK